LANASFFLFGRDPKTGDVVGPYGTGVFVHVPRPDRFHYLTHVYAVSCHHVAVADGASILRINTKSGGSRLIETEPHEWEFIGGGDDLAAVDVTDRFDAGSDEILFIRQALFVSKEFMRAEEIGIGEDGFMLGLFANHPGGKRNLVAARFGNLSLLANDDAPLQQPNGQWRPTHIFDMRSRSGFSGSPVFIYRTPGGDLRESANRGEFESFRRRDMRMGAPNPLGIRGDYGGDSGSSYAFEIHQNTFLALLGIHLGHYSETIEAKKIRKAEPESDDIIRDRDLIKISGGMTIVAPAWEITKLLDLPVFQEQRRKREQRLDAMRSEQIRAEPESIGQPGASAEPLTPSAASGARHGEATEADEYPQHREDFSRLLNAAAKKPPQAGET
jgi:hypothetical protein